MKTVTPLGDFDVKLISWVEGIKALLKAHYEQNFPNLDVPELTTEPGVKFIRVVTGRGNQRSVYAFIDKTNGDVLRAASWKKPAKHARGNIFDESNGLSRVGPYGPEYLK